MIPEEIKDKINVSVEWYKSLHSHLVQYPLIENVHFRLKYETMVEINVDLGCGWEEATKNEYDAEEPGYRRIIAVPLSVKSGEEKGQEEFDKLQIAFQKQAQIKDEYFLEIERLKGLMPEIAKRFYQNGMQAWIKRFQSDRLSNNEDFKVFNEILSEKWDKFKSENNL